MSTYPMVRALVRHGSLLAAVTAALSIVLGIFLAATQGAPVYLAVGIVVGALLYVLLKSYVELVAIIADMMLPK